MATFWGGNKAELIDDLALHIVYGSADDAINFTEIDVHLSFVGIGHDANLRLHGIIVSSIEWT